MKGQTGAVCCLNKQRPCTDKSRDLPDSGTACQWAAAPETPEKGVVKYAAVYYGNAYRSHDGDLPHVPPESKSFGKRGRVMAKRNCRFEVRLTKDEYYELTKKARKAGLTTGAFVRMAVAGQKVVEAPSADVPVLIREVRRVGYNIDQILKIANAGGLLQVPDLRRALEELRTVEKQIASAYGF